jgi:hypothetical protein
MNDKLLEEYKENLKRRMISVHHESHHRRGWSYHDDCLLCRHIGKDQIEGGHADKIRLTKQLYRELIGSLEGAVASGTP